jgi:hypothetical protein
MLLLVMMTNSAGWKLEADYRCDVTFDNLLGGTAVT